ncbi:MAG: Xaa-Pro peptidase family protein [Gammaproteobacteria bacterium]|nr:Xaa-Pro peptidase family protein [Gammaproteobacteria bacterium]
MSDAMKTRTAEFQQRLMDDNIDAALLTDADSIYYLSGYIGYLGVEFGRPTLMLVPNSGDCLIVTPLMESEMGRHMTWVSNVKPWEDGVNGEWTGQLRQFLSGFRSPKIGIERLLIPALVSSYVYDEFSGAEFMDVTPILGNMRAVKSAEEISIMRQAGEVAIAMTEAAERAIGEGVPEYEVALAVIAGGTRKAAELLSDDEMDRFVSPTIYNLQILNSGHDTCMVHRRSTMRRLQRGDPIYCCYCGLANFRHFKLGFDREYFVGDVTDEQARLYEITLNAQKASLDMLRPGVPADEVHAAANSVYLDAGFGPGYRTGRGIGYSFLEKPELKFGDKTPLEAGMTFSVDAAVTIPGDFAARIGDSVVVTENGYEYLTPYPKDLRVL